MTTMTRMVSLIMRMNGVHSMIWNSSTVSLRNLTSSLSCFCENPAPICASCGSCGRILLLLLLLLLSGASALLDDVAPGDVNEAIDDTSSSSSDLVELLDEVEFVNVVSVGRIGGGSI